MAAGEMALCVYARPRTGKTTAIAYLVAKLRASNQAVVASIQVEQQQRLNQIDRAEFWQWFLISLGVPMLSRNPASNRLRLIRHIQAAAEGMGTRRIMFICDEAQNLVVQHLAMLKQLCEELIYEGLDPFVLMLGQPEIQKRPFQLTQAGHTDLVDRFFLRMCRLRGIFPKEFRLVLEYYDQARWPSDGPTFTEYFARGLFSEGWRLGQETAQFTQAFENLHEKLSLGPIQDLEIKFLTTSVRLMLTELLRAEDARKSLRPADLVELCVQASGLIESRRVIGNAEPVRITKADVAAKLV